MKFHIADPVRVTAVKNITTKTGKDIIFVTFANKTSFEVFETKLVLAENQNESEIVEGYDYNAIVEYDGNYGSVTLTPVKAAVGFPATLPATK